MAVGKINNQLKAVEKMVVMAAAATAIAAGINNIQLKAVVEKNGGCGSGGDNGSSNSNGDGNSCKLQVQ
jgi:hypothetical protein